MTDENNDTMGDLDFKIEIESNADVPRKMDSMGSSDSRKAKIQDSIETSKTGFAFSNLSG